MSARLKNILIGLASLLLGIATVFAAIAISRYWLEGPVLPCCNAIRWVLTAMGAGAFLSVVCLRKKLENSGPLHFLFLGLFTLGALLPASVAAWFITPPVVTEARQSKMTVRVVVDTSDAVLFPDENGMRTGLDVWKNNVLASIVRETCHEVDYQIDPEEQQAPQGFWQWLLENAQVLVNFDVASTSSEKSLRQAKRELWFLDGEKVRQISSQGSVKTALKEQWEQPSVWPLQPTGLPVKNHAWLTEGDPNTIVLVLATADVNFQRDARAWKDIPRKASTARGKVVSFVLPSVPRSGRHELRGSLFKAQMLKWHSDSIVRLEYGAIVGPEETNIPIFADLKSLNGTDPTWGEATDLDDFRRKYFGRNNLAAPQETWASQIHERVREILHSDPWNEKQSAGDTPPLGILAVGAAICVFLGFAALAVPKRTIALFPDIDVPSRRTREWLLGMGALGLLAALHLVYQTWPGPEWQQHGRPALAVWAYIAVWSVLVPWSILYKAWNHGSDEHRWRDRAVALLIVAALCLHPVVGLGLGIRNPPLNAALLLLVPPLLLVVACLSAKSRDSEDPGEKQVLMNKPWAHPMRWGSVATVAAVLAAALVIGFVSQPGGPDRFAWSLAILVAVGLLMSFSVWLEGYRASALRTKPQGD
jgi:hypothetical protein